jgi:lipopolysaccharide transport system permease protein
VNGPEPLRELARTGWIVHRASSGLDRSYFARLFAWRELLVFFAWRDLKLKQKQMLLGMSWTVLQPVIQMVLFSLVLGHFAGLPSEGALPYSLLVFSGLVPWQYFAGSVTRSSASLVMNEALLTKAAFPRLLLPLASVLPAVVDVLAGLGVLAALMAWYQVVPEWTVIFLPLFLGLTMITALAVGIWLSALSARYRDIQYLLPFILQVWMLATPVGYSVEIVPEGVTRYVYELNPLAVIVRGIRWSLFGTPSPTAMHLASLLLVLVVLTLGIVYFRRVERTLADVI